ncbi:luciferin sulfotransferase-like [Phlebotomus argentipes]|uniref:luciferin sulfotransferase-like n=1 Tax=Phlebotomus argentipes TaxID=94469 RepID=UPI002892FCB3|nr:luciferin sulfotransferase-like [Phlebotomus argentipes]
MSIVCEKIQDKEVQEKANFGGCYEFILLKNIKWNKDRSCFHTHLFRDRIESYYNFEVRPDDVFLVSFPKSGTTFSQEMVWQISQGIDFETPKVQPQEIRFPHLEMNSMFAKEMLDFPDRYAILNERKTQRFIKSHLPAPFLPKQVWSVKPKIIYVARNAKDTAISYYHFYKHAGQNQASLREFLDFFMNDNVLYGPYHNHVIDFWQMRNEENIHFITFQDMKRDLPSVIEKTAKFLGKSLSKEQILTLADYLSFDTFSKNTSVNREDMFLQLCNTMNLDREKQDYNFIRKGKSGSFREEMPEDLIEKFNEWTLRETEKANVDPEIQSVFFGV